MQVVSASRLTDGTVVYLDSRGDWAESLACARIFDSEPDVQAGLEQAKAAIAASKIIDAFAVPVAQSADGLHAISLRNAIRELGPTVAFKTSPAAAARR
jgi:hypothetical protein